MLRKELLFSAKFDNAEFDKSIEQMQKKLKDLYAPADMARMQTQTAQRLQSMGIGGAAGSPGSLAHSQASMSSRRQLEQIIAQEAKSQEKLAKDIAKQLEATKKLQEAQKELVKGSKEELEIAEKLARVKENSQKMTEAYKQKNKAMGEGMDMIQSLRPQGMDRLMQAYKGGGIGGVLTAGGRMMGGMAPGALAGMLGSGLLSALNLGNTAGQIYGNYVRNPVETATNRGSAMTGMFGREIGAAYSGRQGAEMAFNPEKMQAAAMAQRSMSAIGARDFFSAASNLGTAVGVGAGAGAIGGSVIPGVGTGAGAIIGGGVGLMRGLSDKDTMNTLMSPFLSSSKEAVDARRAKAFADNYAESLEGLKAQNPFKVMAAEDYQANMMGNLDFQRQTGLNYDSFHGPGGFREQMINGGFTSQMGTGMGSAIIGAGGSTRGGREALFGLEMQRGLGLTNSANILGSISGGVGGGDATKQATIKILAEGMRLGLDDSKFAEENRRFTQAAAEVIGRSGAQTSGDFQRLTGTFGGFQAENTIQGIDAGKSAYGRYQQISGETSGPRGVMRAASLMQDPALSKLSTVDKQALLSFSEEQLTEDNPVVQRAAEVAGISPEEVIKKMKGGAMNAVSRFARADVLRDQIAKETDPAKKRSLQNERAAYLQAEQGFGTARELTAFGAGTETGGVTSTLGGLSAESTIAGRMKGATGRVEDTSIAGMAEGSRLVLDNFREFKNDLVPAAKAIAEFNEQLKIMVKTTMSMDASSRNTIFGAMFGTPTQTQSGKGSK